MLVIVDIMKGENVTDRRLMTSSMLNMIPSHGVILAAGSGSRMPSLTSRSTPKALLPIANKPMFHHPLNALLSVGITNITIIIPEQHEQIFQHSINNIRTSTPNANIHLLTAGLGTADAIKCLQPVANDIIILSADYVGDIVIPDLLNFHYVTNSSFTTALTKTPKPDARSMPKSSRSSKPSKPVKAVIDHYAIISQNTLHALIRPTDIQSTLSIPRSLLNIPDLTLRSDLFDPHVYVIHYPTVCPILQQYPAISSIRFDLLPYLARRQAVLTRRAESGEPVSVRSYITDAKAARANTVDEYLRINLDARGVKDKTRGRNQKLPFETVGERVSVSDSMVMGGTAGDRVSVKKSVVGIVALQSGVKINSCVLMDDVVIKEGANLSGCIVCKGGIVEAGVVLKNCRVAEGVSVSADAEGQDFVGKEKDWGDDIEFC